MTLETVNFLNINFGFSQTNNFSQVISLHVFMSAVSKFHGFLGLVGRCMVIGKRSVQGRPIYLDNSTVGWLFWV